MSAETDTCPEKLRVCHVITRMIIGGAQENTLASVQKMDASRFSSVLVAGEETGPEGSLWPAVEAAGIEAVRMPRLVRRIHPLSDLLAYRALVTLFRERRPDIVHTHSSKAGVLGRLAARRAGVPRIIHTIHG